MGKYIGENIQYGSFERQKITLEYDPITESVVNTYTLTQRVSNESSIFVVCDKILLQPVKDYVIVKEGFSQKIRFKIDLDAIEDSDQTIGNVEIYVVYLGKELLNSSVPSVANIQDVTINNETLAAGQVLAYTSEGWKNRDVGDILSLGGSYPSLFDEVEFLKNTSAPRTWVQTQLSNLKNEILDSPPGVLDTLNELAAALGDDANFATTVAGQIGAVESDVSALDIRVSTLESNVVAIDSSISSITNRVSVLESDVAEIDQILTTKADSSSLASVATSGSYDDLINTPDLASVATSGSYDDLINTPDLASVATSGSYEDLVDTPVLFSGDYNDLTNTPTLFSGDYNDLTNTPTLADVALSGSYLNLSDTPTLADVSISGSYNDLVDKPIAVVPGLNATQGQFLAHNGTEFVSTNTLEVSDPANQPLIIKGATLQSANLLELRDSTDSVVTYIKPDGTISTRRFVENVANSFNTTLAPTSGTLTINTLLGTCVLGTLNSSVTLWDFTNVPTDSGKSTMVSVVLSGNTAYTYGDACTVNGASVSGGIKWCAGIVPTATSGTDIISFLIIRDQSGTVQVFGSATTNFS
jgi:hypothetical protein